MAQQSLQEILRELREFRAQQQPHDLSVLRHRYQPARDFNTEQENEQEQPVKKSKRNKRPVESEE